MGFFTSPFFTPPSPSPLPPVGVRGVLRRTADFASSLRLRIQLGDVEFFTPPSPNPLPPVGVRGALRRTADFVSSLRLRIQLGDAEFFTAHSPQPSRPRRAMGSLRRTADFVPHFGYAFNGAASVGAPHLQKVSQLFIYSARNNQIGCLP